ncbi:hypothetical protein [Sulfurimonas sp.]|jgi:uncharacterized protein (DUF302 family)|uniref:hypothetical protein n=1 Tax=Sulfurimonas sp. TaxID=2022749 RepID=UPI0025DA3A94|nr:hypothetical protein [Sulfurimonas sp.]MCK9472242.1 hypothetical protein [Sulfurimonas sp.]MDD3505217.1 hypothetical protein [Sulfurimonas sp.]
MLKTIVKIAVLASLSASIAFGYQAIRLNVSEGTYADRNDAFKGIMELDLEDAGFTPKDIHAGIEYYYRLFYGTKLLKDGKPNPQFKEDYVENLDNLGFITISNEEWMLPLLLKEPSLGGFAPLNYLIYKKKSENKTYVGTITPEAMLDITKVKDPEVRKTFTEYIDALSKATDNGMGGEVEFIEIDKLPKKTMVEFEVPFERGSDVIDAKFNFMERFEKAFEAQEYIIAGKRDFEEYWTDNDMDNPRFDAYWVYSLCHFTFSYTVFNAWEHPELGVSAPCSMYMYLEKDSNTLKVGMPSVENWIVFGGIKDPQKVKFIKEMDEKIKAIMISLGAKEI